MRQALDWVAYWFLMDSFGEPGTVTAADDRPGLSQQQTGYADTDIVAGDGLEVNNTVLPFALLLLAK